jgi:hypothetical protein
MSPLTEVNAERREIRNASAGFRTKKTDVSFALLIGFESAPEGMAYIHADHNLRAPCATRMARRASHRQSMLSRSLAPSIGASTSMNSPAMRGRHAQVQQNWGSQSRICFP